ncbi:MAG TPA: UDP-glucose 4-epimerase GalE [Candidatus Angelobacter sp.]|nr:UDP-glucose 4-epimerase GalE [Candidatus Angelobacter sp.]
MKVLVTGGAGYIGSIVAEQLVAGGHPVVVYDDLSHGYRQAVPEAAEFVQASVGDSKALDQALSGVDAVMHFAGLIEAGESMKRPEAFFRANTANTLTLLEAMLAHKVKAMVFSSTAAVYGDPERVPIVEESPLRPTNTYGESKLMVEQMLAWFHRIHGLRYCALRYFNAAGATSERGEAHQPESHLIPLVLQTAMGKRERITIFGNDYPTPDGTCVRDYIHVSDLANAHLLALNALKENTRLIYNVGTGTGASVREVVEAAREVTGREIPAKVERRRAGDPAILVASSEKIRRELGWKPRYTDIRDIIKSAWEWHLGHPEGYREVAESASSTQPRA